MWSYEVNELEKLGIEAGIISDTDDSSKSVYSDATDPYYLHTEAELFKVLKKIGTNTIWGFALQRSWFNRDYESKEFKVIWICGRSHKKWLEEERLVDFVKKDMRTRQLYCLSTFSSGEDLFQHVVEANSYESLVYLGLMHNLLIL